MSRENWIGDILILANFVSAMFMIFFLLTGDGGLLQVGALLMNIVAVFVLTKS